MVISRRFHAAADIWAFVTPTVTVYRIMDGRGYAEACSVLGADFDGTLLRDDWSPYRRFEQATHQTCVGGPLIRRCKEILETAWIHILSATHRARGRDDLASGRLPSRPRDRSLL